MIEGKKYDVFQSPKQNLAEQNPELSFIVNKMYFDNEAGVKLDTILRYVVYFYDRRCEMHTLHTNVGKARIEALRKFSIPKKVYDSISFIETESEMARRYMLWNRDNEFSVFLTISIQLEDLNAKIRAMAKDSSMKENVESLRVSNDIISLSEQIDTRRKILFGNMNHIEKFAMQKEIDNMFKAESGMI